MISFEGIVRTRRAYIKLAPRFTSYRLGDGGEKGAGINWEFSLGSELLFHSSAQLIFAVASWEEISQLHLGLGYGRGV